MKSVLFRATCILGFGLALGWAKAGHADSGEMIEVGGDSADQTIGATVGVGFASLGGDHYAEVLLRLQFDGVKISDRIVVARLRADMSAGGNGVGYLDIDFNALEIGEGISDFDGKTHYSGWATIGGVDIQRNLALGNNLLARITVLGFRADWDKQVSAQVRLLASTAVDFLAFGIVPVAGDLRAMSTVAIDAKIGAVFGNRFRVALGEKIDSFSVIDDKKYTGTYCSTNYVSNSDMYNSGTLYSGVYTGPGMYTSCQDQYQEINGEHRIGSKTTLDLEYEISKHFSAFGSANFVVYKAYNVRNTVENVEQNAYAFQAMFGVLSRW